MHRQYVRNAIKQGRYRFFAGAHLPIPPNKLLLLDDILASVKSLLADQKRITPDQLASIVPIAENTSTGLVVRFVMVPPAQADITKSEGMTIDEAAFRDVEKRLVVCAKIAANSIDEGNAFALTEVAPFLRTDFAVSLSEPSAVTSYPRGGLPKVPLDRRRAARWVTQCSSCGQLYCG